MRACVCVRGRAGVRMCSTAGEERACPSRAFRALAFPGLLLWSHNTSVSLHFDAHKESEPCDKLEESRKSGLTQSPIVPTLCALEPAGASVGRAEAHRTGTRTIPATAGLAAVHASLSPIQHVPSLKRCVFWRVCFQPAETSGFLSADPMGMEMETETALPFRRGPQHSLIIGD